MKIKFCILLVAFFLIFLPNFSQIPSTVPSAVSVANISVAVQNEWNAFQNVSALANINKFEVGAQYENHFMVKELSAKTIQIAKNFNTVNVGASFSYFGYSLYNDILLGVGTARNFDNKFSMGVQFNYYATYFSGQEINRYRATIFPQFGVSSKIFPQLIIGFNAFNPFQSNIKTEYTLKRIPSIFSFGTNYSFAENVIWLSQIDKEVSSNFRFATGFEYKLIDQFTLKLGAYAQNNLVPCLGANIKLSKFNVYFNTELHPLLGLNTQVCLKYKY